MTVRLSQTGATGCPARRGRRSAGQGRPQPPPPGACQACAAPGVLAVKGASSHGRTKGSPRGIGPLCRQAPRDDDVWAADRRFARECVKQCHAISHIVATTGLQRQPCRDIGQVHAGKDLSSRRRHGLLEDHGTLDGPAPRLAGARPRQEIAASGRAVGQLSAGGLRAWRGLSAVLTAGALARPHGPA
jgi:hypothetical protein